MKPATAHQVFRSRAIVEMLQEAHQLTNRTHRRAYKRLMAAGLLEEPSPLQNGILKLNLHDSRLDAVLRPNVRQTLLVIDAVGSIHLRGLARCLAYTSLKAVRNAVQAIKATGLIEVQAFRERELLRLIREAIAEPINPIDEVP